MPLISVGPPTTIFMHIPKAAGSTLNSVLDRIYPRNIVLDVGGPNSGRESIFEELSLEDRARIRLIKGHLLFGIHEFVPMPSSYITILRDPVDRVISHYYFVKRRPRHRLHQLGSSLTLEDYISSGASLELNNGQVRALYGREHLNVEYGGCSRSMLDRALENAQSHFSVIGLSNRFDETLLLMKKRLGWNRLPLYVARNVTKERPALHGVPAHVIQKIEKDNELDLELYATAGKLFTEEVERHEIGREIDSFRRRNAIYGRCAGPLFAARSSIGMIKARRLSAVHV